MISIVVYGRNDNYGYNLSKRAAIGLNCMAEVLTDPDDEILFVDYNTPDTYPTFPEAIRDTLTDNARRLLRIFRVRPNHHASFARRTHLLVLESIARNVAVRRSNPANRWILSTNTEMIFVPRVGNSLSEIVAKLPRGFYAIPRFEVPESLWESFDRTDPHRIMTEVARWGWDAFLNDVVFSVGKMFGHDDWILYDAPGDFQLVERADLFTIDGFDEEMLLGWHVDGNLFRRLSLYYGGQPTSDLADRVFGYHPNHLRQLTAVHDPDAPHNDYQTYYLQVTQPDLPRQRARWGFAGVEIEEISLQQTPTHIFLDAVKATLGTEGVGELSRPRGRIDYDERHVLPFLLNVFVSAPRSLSVAWVGTEPEMFRLFLHAWQAMGFTSRVRVPTEFTEVLAGNDTESIERLGLVRTCMGADTLIFDFAQRLDLEVKQQAARNGRLLRALDLFCEVERLRLERRGVPPVLPRQVVAVNAIHNAFDPLVRDRLQCTLSPYCTRIRTGFVSRTAFRHSKQHAGPEFVPA